MTKYKLNKLLNGPILLFKNEWDDDEDFVQYEGTQFFDGSDEDYMEYAEAVLRRNREKVMQWYKYNPDWVENYLVWNAEDYNKTREENWRTFLKLVQKLGIKVLYGYLVDVGQEEELKDCLYYISTHDVEVTEWDENGEYDREGLDD